MGLWPRMLTNLRTHAVSKGACGGRLESTALLDDALEELAGGAPSGREHDNLGLLREEEAGAEDGDAADAGGI